MSSFFSKLLTRMSPPPGAPEDREALRDERDTFALRVQAILATLGLGAEYDPDEFALRLATGSVSWLGNRFDEYRRAPETEREGIVLHVARGIVDAGLPSPVTDDWDDARAQLRPRIRQRAHLVILGLQMEADGLDADGLLHAFLPITTDLGAEVMFDTPTNIVSIPSGKLDRWAVDARTALDVSIANLRASAPDPFRSIGDGVYAAVGGDCYDSARMLLVDEIAALPVDGAPVALPANRDTLVVTGADNLGGLYRVLQVALAALDRPRMDTLQPAVLRDGRWEDWLPPPDHPMREAYYELAVRTRGTAYAELRELLLRRQERSGEDLFVASFGVYRGGTAEPPWSHAIWPPVRGWLPEADLVSVLNPDDDRYIVVPQAALRAHAGHLLAPVEGLHPPYLAFDGAPDRALWLRLRDHALREGTMVRRTDR